MCMDASHILSNMASKIMPTEHKEFQKQHKEMRTLCNKDRIISICKNFSF